MFECKQCHKSFSRKDSLSRHIRNLHMREFSPNRFENSYSLDSPEKQASDMVDDLSSYHTEKNDSDDEFRNSIAEERSNPLEQRIKAASETIQTKFNNLRNQCKVYTPSDESSNRVSTNSGVIISQLTTALQTALDILLIKENQNDWDNSNEGRAMKRPVNSSDQELLAKRIKYNGSDDFESGNEQFKKVKYWNNPNTLVDELRRLYAASETGEKVLKIIQSLEKNKGMLYSVEDREALTNELNALKETTVGQEIFSILRELQKADIIEPLGDYLDETFKEDASDYTDADGESGTPSN